MLQNALPAVGLLALMVLLAWALQHWKRHLPGVAASAGPTLKVLNTVAIGPQQRLLSVQVGEGPYAQCLVLGVTAGSIQALHRMPLPTADATGAPSPMPTANGFGARLAQQLTARRATDPHAPR